MDKVVGIEPEGGYLPTNRFNKTQRLSTGADSPPDCLMAGYQDGLRFS